MRFSLIIGLLLVTGFTFFAASKSIDARATEVISATTAEIEQAQRAEVDAALKDAEARHLAEVARLETQNKESAAKQSAMAADLVQALGKIAAAQVQQDATSKSNDELVAKLSVADDEVRQKTDQLQTAQATIAGLSGTVEDRQAAVNALENKLAGAQLQAEKFAQRIAALEVEAGAVKQNDATAKIAVLEDQVAQQENDLTATQTRIAALLDQVAAQTQMTQEAQDRITGLDAEVAYLERERLGLIKSMTKRDTEIQELRASVLIPAKLTVASCTEATNALFSDNKISFRTGTNVVDQSSSALLDQLAEVAFDCVHSDLAVTIGGHTDSQGTVRNNQALSERRATAIRNFLGTRGLPSASMRVVGYGESQPIADNTTRAGRAENRRITFEWQER